MSVITSSDVPSTTTQNAALQSIHVYPVKSTAGIALSTAWVTQEGLSFDRRFMVKLANGAMATGRQFPHMVLIRSCLIHDGLVFHYPNKPTLTLSYADLSRQTTTATVWSDQFNAYATSDEADAWFSDILGEPAHLLYCGEQSQRIREKIAQRVSFADGYPLLLISQGSLNALNRLSPTTHSMDQFRTNLVIDSEQSFIEDSWKTIQIGSVIFDVVKPCQRCIFTTIDLKQAAFRANQEPLTTLSQFRADEAGRIFFGQNLVAQNEGMIEQGDKVVVLEYQVPQHYLPSC